MNLYQGREHFGKKGCMQMLPKSSRPLWTESLGCLYRQAGLTRFGTKIRRRPLPAGGGRPCQPFPAVRAWSGLYETLSTLSRRHDLLLGISATFECTQNDFLRSGQEFGQPLQAGILLEGIGLIGHGTAGKKRDNVRSGSTAAHIIYFFPAVQGLVRPARNAGVLSEQGSPPLRSKLSSEPQRETTLTFSVERV